MRYILLIQVFFVLFFVNENKKTSIFFSFILHVCHGLLLNKPMLNTNSYIKVQDYKIFATLCENIVNRIHISFKIGIAIKLIYNVDKHKFIMTGVSKGTNL